MKIIHFEDDDSDAHRLSEQLVELEAGEVYEREWINLDTLESVAALIETLGSGETHVEFEGPPGQWATKDRVRLYAGKIGQGTKRIALRIKASVKSSVRVTVAFLKKEGRDALKRMSCKACKTFIKLSINVILTSLGLPTISTDVPFIEHLHIGEVTQRLAAVVHSAGSLLPQGVQAFFAGISPTFWQALEGTFAVVGFFTEALERSLAAACRVIGCCKEMPAEA
jgi:hypothetical protein